MGHADAGDDLTGSDRRSRLVAGSFRGAVWSTCLWGTAGEPRTGQTRFVIGMHRDAHLYGDRRRSDAPFDSWYDAPGVGGKNKKYPFGE